MRIDRGLRLEVEPVGEIGNGWESLCRLVTFQEIVDRPLQDPLELKKIIITGWEKGGWRLDEFSCSVLSFSFVRRVY